MLGNFLNMLSGAVFSVIGAFVGLLPGDIFFSGGQVGELWAAIAPGSRNAMVDYVSFFIPVNLIVSTVGFWAAAMFVYITVRDSIRLSKGF